jgi:hypothetical protein
MAMAVALAVTKIALACTLKLLSRIEKSNEKDALIASNDAVEQAMFF